MPKEKKLEKAIETIDGVKTVVISYGAYSLHVIDNKGRPYINKQNPSNFGIIEKDLYKTLFRAGSAYLGCSNTIVKNTLNKDVRGHMTFWVSDYEVKQIRKLLKELRKAP